ncbi:MAG: hypothetical protein OEZ06_01245 [Myxococcales bacterium]|nr:hypothetical protein [Myxococcales bacterium]
MFERVRSLFSSASKSQSGGGPASIELRPRDCHCHAIAGVDDGSRSLEESIAMLRLLSEAGAGTVVCTSHIFPGRFPNEPDDLKRGFEALHRALEASGLGVELELGAEHFLDESLPGRVREGRVLAFGPERYLLFETITSESVPVGLFEAVSAMTEKGYVPLLAHVERYRWLRDNDSGEEVLYDLRSAGVKFQVNRTVGKVNVPGQGSRGRFLSRLIERGFVDEVGSDLHRPTPEGRPYANGE